tara:strand:+ start:1909 stop:4368 length:2460 start_codon:yes stop_codon:yes gene_type:complete
MPLISRAIPTLLRGVSQSSDSLKQADHADIQDNADSNPVLGLTKRSGLNYVTALANSPLGNVHIQTINRDTSEQYVAIFSNGNVQVYDLAGNSLNVEKPDGVAYLSTTNARSVIKTVTIADYTFVVNTSITPVMDSALSAGTDTQAIVFINQATANTTYTVTVDGVTVTDNTSGDNPLSTDTVAADIKSGLDSGLTGFTIERNGPVLHIKKNDGSNFSIDGSDTQGDTKMTIIKDSVQRFTDLPTVSPNGYVVEVKGDEDTNFDNYYVKFVTNNGGTFEEGQWEETVEDGIPFKFNYDTMPHVLIRQADGNFRFARVDGDTYTVTVGSTTASYTLPKWGERTAGDLESAPDPSFIGRNINNVFFFRNRLGFLAGDNVILSEVSKFFNFFPETVISVLDSEPIDVAASHTKVAILKHAVTMGERLILFSEQTQFTLTSSSDNLTPKSANVLVATEFESSAAAAPVGSGSSIYFLTKKGSFAGIREYITQGDSQIKDAANTTVHVPKLIPSGIFKMAVSNNQDILVLLGSDNPNKLFLNRWLYGENFSKVLNAWFTYTINPNRKFLNIDFIGTDLFAVIEEDNKVTLEKIPFETDFTEPNSKFEFYLDHKVTEATTGVGVSYNAVTDKTEFSVPYRLRAKMTVVGRYLSSTETSTFVNTNGQTKNLLAGQVIGTTNLTDGSTSTIIANGDYRNSKFIIGEPFEMHYRFSKQRLTGQAGASELLSGRLQIHHFYIKYEDSSFFQVEVTPENRDTSIHKFSGRLLGSNSSVIGEINLDTGTFKVPVMSKSDRVDIDIKNNTFLPTRIASAEYEGIFHMKARRM